MKYFFKVIRFFESSPIENLEVEERIAMSLLGSGTGLMQVVFTYRAGLYYDPICLLVLSILAILFLYLFKYRIISLETLSFNKPLVELGASTSFLLHEVSKPLSRLNAKEKNSNDLNSVIELVNMAKTLSSGDAISSELEINLKEIITEVLSKYSDELAYFKVQVLLTNLNVKVKSNYKLLFIIIDNLIRNAIENFEENFVDYKIAIEYENNILLISNDINESNLNFKVELGNSSKKGHMGVGLFLVSKLASSLNIKFNNVIKNRKFICELEFLN